MSGYAKSILTMATCLIVATYSISIKGVQSRATQTAVSRVQAVQTEQVQKSVIRVILNKLNHPDAGTHFSSRGSIVMAGIPTSYSMKFTGFNMTEHKILGKIFIETSNGEIRWLTANIEGNYDSQLNKYVWKKTAIFG